MQRQKHFRHGKIIFVMAKTFSPRQNHFSSRQNHFRNGKNNFVTVKSFSSRQKQFYHGKIIFRKAKTISPRQNHFRHGRIICTHVTLIRKVLWESIQHGGQLAVLSSVILVQELGIISFKKKKINILSYNWTFEQIVFLRERYSFGLGFHFCMVF